MNRQTKILALIALTVALLAGIGVLVVHRSGKAPAQDNDRVASTTNAAQTEEKETLPSRQTEPSAGDTEETAGEEQTEQTEETGPQEQRYILSFVGDCTTGSTPSTYWYESSYIQTIGDDYSYPFRLVREYFEADDFTMANLETALTKDGAPADKLFTFRGPAEYTEIFTGSSVEAVTLANNHSMDFGTVGYNSTIKALKEANLPYVEKNGTAMVTTDSGLKIGLYAACFDFSVPDMKAKISSLRNQGAEIVVCAFHWGVEGSYRTTGNQEYFGRAAIDAGADIVYGHHPHVLQKIEKYGSGVILYSLGNFSFGGNPFPKDYDSAILQVEVIRDVDGKLRLGDTTAIPVLFSSMKGQNNYQPMPVEEGTEDYDRIMSKLDGTFTGPDLVVYYNNLNPTDPSEESTEPSEDTRPTEGDKPAGVTDPTENTDPTETTPAPTETTPAPTETTPAPTETTPAPTETTPAPTETTPAPTETTPAPPPEEPGDAA